MNPIEGMMQHILRRLGAPSSGQVKELAKSPFVTDTLAPAIRNYTLPSRMRPAHLEDGVYGLAYPNSSEVYINTNNADWLKRGDTPAGTRNLRNTAIHEAAHVAGAPREDFPNYFSVTRPEMWFDGNEMRRGKAGSGTVTTRDETFDMASGRVKFGEGRKGMFPKASQAEMDAIKALDPYYREGKEARLGGGSTDYEGESFAQAMTNAMGFLDENSRGVQPDYRERIGRLEGNTPGAGQIVRDLLAKPVYANHPLRSVIR